MTVYDLPAIQPGSITEALKRLAENSSFRETTAGTIGNFVDPRTPFMDERGFGWLSRAFGFVTTARDRAEGRMVPIYDNEMDLRAIRMSSRLLHCEIPVAEAMRRRLKQYTISSGFDWSLKHESESVQKVLKKAVDEVLQNANWPQLEVETFDREVEDGEALGRIVRSMGDFSIEIIEPEYLVEPAATRELDEHYGFTDFPASWTFGVVTPERRTDQVKGYHICRDGVGADWDFYRPHEIFHWKRNVTMNAKRGVGDSFRTLRWLRHAEKVLANTAHGTAIQAAIAYIVEHAQGTTGEQAQRLASERFNSNTVVRNDYRTGNEYNRREMRAGTVVDIKAGAKFHAGLLGSVQSNIFVEVMEALFRITGTIDAFPESMLTGYAGNNNRASSETAESPFIQGRKQEQRLRAEAVRSLIKKIVRLICEELGWDWEVTKQGLEIIVQPPDIVSRDIGTLTTALATQKQNGWVTDQLAIQQLGYDYEDVETQKQLEKEKAAEEAAKMPRQGFQGNPASQDGIQQPGAIPGQPGGQPGQPGQGVFQEGFDPLKHPRRRDGKFANKPRATRPADDSTELLAKKLTEAAKTFQHAGLYGKSEWMKRKSGVNSAQAIEAIHARAMAFAEHLQAAGIVSPFKVELNVSVADKNHKPEIEKARRWLSAVGANSLTEAKVMKARHRRDSYERGVVYLAGVTTFPGTVIHEFGHHLEMESAKVQGQTQRFVEDRIYSRNLRQVPMSTIQQGYSDREIGAIGFTNAFESEPRGAYAAVRYSQGGTEALAMGLQALHDNPVKFIKSDPEFAAFVLEQLN